MLFFCETFCVYLQQNEFIQMKINAIDQLWNNQNILMLKMLVSNVSNIDMENINVDIYLVQHKSNLMKWEIYVFLIISAY